MPLSQHAVLSRLGHGRWGVDAEYNNTLFILAIERGSAHVDNAASGHLTPNDVFVTRLDRRLTVIVDPFAVVITTKLNVPALEYDVVDTGTFLHAQSQSAVSLLRHALVGLSSDSLGQPTELAPRVQHQVSAILLSAFAEHAAQKIHGTAKVFLDARQLIESRLSDPELGQELIASTLNVSARTLYRAFRAHKVTVNEWIRNRRLENCRAELEDPGLSYMPVSLVAARWGLIDAAHFSRMFKSQFGVSPKEYRQRALQLAA